MPTASHMPCTRLVGGLLLVAGAEQAGHRRGRAVGEEDEDRVAARSSDAAGDGQAGERVGAEVTDDRGVGEDVERLGDQGAERRDGQPQDLAIVGTGPKHRRPHHPLQSAGCAGRVRWPMRASHEPAVSLVRCHTRWG